MRKFTILSLLVLLIACSSDDSSGNGISSSLKVNNVDYDPTPNSDTEQSVYVVFQPAMGDWPEHEVFYMIKRSPDNSNEDQLLQVRVIYPPTESINGKYDLGNQTGSRYLTVGFFPNMSQTFGMNSGQVTVTKAGNKHKFVFTDVSGIDQSDNEWTLSGNISAKFDEYIGD